MYNPLTGDGYTKPEAVTAWAASMGRSAPRWSLRGEPGAWHWSFFNFKPYCGRVTVEADGLHWSTTHYDTGEQIHAGVTTSLYEAFQSVERNAPVKYEGK